MFRTLLRTCFREPITLAARPSRFPALPYTNSFTLRSPKNLRAQIRSFHEIGDYRHLATRFATFEAEFQRSDADLDRCKAESQKTKEEFREAIERYKARMLRIMTVRCSTQRRNARVRLLKAERKVVHQRLRRPDRATFDQVRRCDC